ncbi:MAG: type II secretion system ATPase GspE [Candidatus Tritonobacter lacicola]|nr:type II secretion system ATPase GspE [Candidatus Tritonobacter lacicola]
MNGSQNNQLCSILLERTSLTEAQIKKCLSIQKMEGAKIGQVLMEQGFVTEEELLLALSEQLDVPYVKRITEAMVDRDLLEKVPKNFVQTYRIMPLSKSGNAVKVATTDPLAIQPLDDIGLILECGVQPVLARSEEIVNAINSFYGHAAGAAEQLIEDISGEDIPTQVIDIIDDAEDVLDIANKAPVIKFINLMIFQAVRDRATDIHIEPYEKELVVRYRIDGILYKTLSPPKSMQGAIASRIKIMSHLNIAEKRLPQDGRIRIKMADKDIDIRVSIVPTSFGERIVLRLLYKSEQYYSLDQLGLSHDKLETLVKLIHIPHGIILLTGPTGSGKTTTLYGSLTKINTPDKNIITVEDPVEYQISGIGQIQVNRKINLTFANGLRSILRQDPDVMMVGEIRDLETAEIAIQASLTGHLVFSTLHTNDSAGAVTRLVDMGIEPYLVASSVIAMIAQRLVRVICQHCRESYEPTPETLAQLGLKKSDLKDGVLWRGKGCDSCLKTGYLGRTGIYEILKVDNEIRKMILEKADSNEIKKRAVKKGMLTLRADGLRIVVEGITTLEEIMRVTQEELEEI